MISKIGEENHFPNPFVKWRLVALGFVIPMLVFFWVYLIGGFSFELGIGLAVACLIIYGYIFYKFLLPKV